MTEPLERTLTYEPGLDGVRGLAVAAVLLFHAGHLRGGFLGVDAFFVLSGYLITLLLLHEISSTSTISFRRFYLRRLRRLMPAVVLVIGFVAVYAKFVAAPSELATIRGDGIATLLYGANWREIWVGRDYWAMFRAPSPLAHTWSLAIEEQFYLVWPFAVWCASRLSNVSAVIVVRRVACVGVVVSSGALFALFVESDNARSYFGTDTRISSMFVGAILATVAIPVELSKLMRVIVELAAFVAVAFVVWLWVHVYGTDAWLYRGGFFLQAVAVASVLMAVVQPARGPLFWFVRIAPLRALGVISYGVYLWHWPIYVWLNATRFGRGGWWLVAARVGATLAAATISYWCVERPIRRGQLTSRWVWTGAPIAIAVSAAALIGVTSGYVAEAHSSQAPDAIPAKPIVVDPSAKRPKRVLIVGNSIGYYLAAEGFPKSRAPDAPIVLNRSVIGCRLLREGVEGLGGEGVVRLDGAPCVDTQWDVAVRVWKPDVVVRVMSSATDQKLKLEGHFVGACSEPYRRIAERSLRAEATRLSASGATVVFVTAATPAYPFLSEQWFAADKCLNDLVRAVASSAPHAKLADLQRFMCARELEGCRIDVNGVAMRPDLVHYRHEGAQIAMTWILDHALDS